MALDEKLLEILVCPESKQPLIYFEEEDFLFCPASRLKYTVEDDIPVMLVDEAERLDREEAEQLVEEAQKRGLDHADEPVGEPSTEDETPAS